LFCAFTLTLFFASACDRQSATASPKLVQESAEPLFVEALKKEAQGDPDGALNKLLDLIHARKDGAPEAHFKVAQIYLKKKRPTLAAYHLEEYVRLRPGSERTKQVHDQIQSATSMLITERIPGFTHADNLTEQKNRELTQRAVTLSQQNDRLKRENSELQAQIARIKKNRQGRPNVADPGPPPAPPTLLPPVAITPAVPPPAQDAVRMHFPTTHTVTKNDTLFGISAKYYGTSARWRLIYNANRDKLKHERAALQLGWVLKIPPP
ncbi:MAG: LysM peptidoglycan-binding domain-containing protein, partial [Puniceicoccales bacterium]|jgi:nucleoid-associated protein YgaU|nr:LysM peptidoglycan-binding domain-containing protein [Puniceicoccales bacterium]